MINPIQSNKTQRKDGHAENTSLNIPIQHNAIQHNTRNAARQKKERQTNRPAAAEEEEEGRKGEAAEEASDMSIAPGVLDLVRLVRGVSA